jgi:hypothetical protein
MLQNYDEQNPKLSSLQKHETGRTQPIKCGKWQSSPVTDLEWPRGFQEVKVPRFHDNGTGWW